MFSLSYDILWYMTSNVAIRIVIVYSVDSAMNRVYRRRSNYASFLILRQNTTFQTGNSNDASLSGNSFPIVASHGLAGSKGGRSLLPVTVDVYS